VKLSGAITDHQITLLSDGIDIPVEVKRKNQIQHSMVFRTAPCEIRRLPGHPDTETTIQVTLTEGKNRQIRKMVKAVGLRVRALHRIGFCELTLASLSKPGDWRHLDEEELRVVQNALQTISPRIGEPHRR
jgi:pseudouridine synthase